MKKTGPTEPRRNARFVFAQATCTPGLNVEPRDYSAIKAKDRGRARESSEISFHSLRHSAVTMLKASGLSDVFAREIVGHDSETVSRHYTHLSTDDLRNAMQRLPDITEGEMRTSKSRRTKKA